MKSKKKKKSYFHTVPASITHFCDKSHYFSKIRFTIHIHYILYHPLRIDVFARAEGRTAILGHYNIYYFIISLYGTDCGIFKKL